MGKTCSACFGRKLHSEDEQAEQRRESKSEKPRKNFHQQETPEEREQRQRAIDQRLERVRTLFIGVYFTLADGQEGIEK
jgi:hypothetical protein